MGSSILKKEAINGNRSSCAVQNCTMDVNKNVAKQHICIRNVSNEVYFEDFERLFETYGTVKHIKLAKDFALVTLECSKETALKACSDLNDNIWMENSITVELREDTHEAKSRVPKEWINKLRNLAENLSSMSREIMHMIDSNEQKVETEGMTDVRMQ